MTFDTGKMIRVYCVALVLAGAMMFAYREHLNWDAHWITRILCDDMPVFNGGYKRCLDHYAPATLPIAPV
jgi:hypothetical protein